MYQKYKILGPFLGSTEPGHARIIIGFPKVDNSLEFDTIHCCLENKHHKIIEKIKKYYIDGLGGKYNIFEFEFNNVLPGEIYYYHFLINNKIQNYLDGLSKNECFFKAVEHDRKSTFLLVSCHNPFDTDPNKSTGQSYDIWDNIFYLISDKKANIELIVLAGDQLYCDEIEVIYDNSDKNKIKLDECFIQQYLKYWHNTSYRRVFSKVQSVVIWDDHDITDGWGSREEFLDENDNVKKEWKKYFDEAKNAYKLYQDIRNIKENKIIKYLFTNYIDMGINRIYLLDLRSERNSNNLMIWSQPHQDEFFCHLENIPVNSPNIKNVFIVFPVVLFRTNFFFDKREISVLKQMRKIKSFVKNIFSKFQSRAVSIYISFLLSLTLMLLTLIVLCMSVSCLMAFIILAYPAYALFKCIPDLVDDIEDGLSSDVNRKNLEIILKKLFEFKNNNKNINIVSLSGDIHLCGMTEILKYSDNDTVESSIIQIVSSPVSNKPMDKISAGFTTTTSPMDLFDYKITARNIFYISKRGFVRIIPQKMVKGGKPVEFYLEGHKHPLLMPIEFYKKNT